MARAAINRVDKGSPARIVVIDRTKPIFENAPLGRSPIHEALCRLPGLTLGPLHIGWWATLKPSNHRD